MDIKKDSVISKVVDGTVHFCCTVCANKYREDGKETYDGTYSVHLGTCEICGQRKTVTSAKKLFGYHKFL